MPAPTPPRIRWWALHVTRPEGRRVELSLRATTAIEAERVGSRLVHAPVDVCLAFVIHPAPCSPHERVYSRDLQPGPTTLIRWICRCGARGAEAPTHGTIYEPNETAFLALGGEALDPAPEPTAEQVAEAVEPTRGERVQRAAERMVGRRSDRAGARGICTVCRGPALDGKETCGAWVCAHRASRWAKGRKVGGNR